MTAGSIRLGFVGDLMLARELNFVLDEHPPDWVWGDVLPEMTACEAVVGNLECPITEHPRRWRWGVTKAFHFRARPRAVDCLRMGNVRAVNLANNHMLDHGVQGLADTLRFLDAGGIAHCGAGLDAAGAAEPAVFTAGGLRIGVLGVTDNVPEFGARTDRPGTFRRKIGPDRPLVAELTPRIEKLRAHGADLVILSLHWGPNFRVHPPEAFRGFAHVMIERGVDIVHGHSAHITQAVEAYRGRLILYDTGDFISDYWRFPGHQNLWSFFFRVTVEDRRPAGLELIPVTLAAGSVRQARGAAAEGVVARMLGLCQRTGAALARDGDRLRLAL
jgi:poly-gamma-glutamate capsule biosynthesis protein CapA/YwtB (metallophosphatase superfamily)